MTSVKHNNSISRYEHLIATAVRYGIDEKQFRNDLEYQILSDFLLTNRDRHMNNIGILRDAQTMKFVRMAPIFDTGKSMFVHQSVPEKDDFTNYKVNSFVNYEQEQLKYVRNKDILDIKKALPVERIRELYKMDSRMDIARIDKICKAYELKIKMYKNI